METTVCNACLFPVSFSQGRISTEYHLLIAVFGPTEKKEPRRDKIHERLMGGKTDPSNCDTDLTPVKGERWKEYWSRSPRGQQSSR